jgi:hypothetical protein
MADRQSRSASSRVGTTAVDVRGRHAVVPVSGAVTTPREHLSSATTSGSAAKVASVTPFVVPPADARARALVAVGRGDCPGRGGNGAQQRFQRRFSAVSAQAATFGTSLGPRGEVVIIMLGDGPEEMEITLINCQADKSDEAACHHIP